MSAIGCAVAILTIIVPHSEARAQAGLANLPALPPVMACTDVVNMNLAGVTDALVTIQSATVVTTGAVPSCDVRGTIAPANLFALSLPIQGWTQRYVEVGCGGLCGRLGVPITPPEAVGCAPITNGQAALATTDMGHEGQNDGSWGLNNPQAKIDFAYRSMHVLAQTAKGIIAQFYGAPPAYSYFDGCSDGGREALMEAQRYPDDFDGIVAGAPANDLVVQNTFHHGWNVLANRDAYGNPILLASKLPLIHNAVVAACDALDGVADGVLDDPRRCDFDPNSLLCTTPWQDPSTCLSAAEAAVVRRLHDGATDAGGRRLEQQIAHEWGSELDWTLFVPAAPGQATFSESIALSFLQYLAYYNYALPNYQLSDLQFTVPHFNRTVETSHFWAATDPDLTSFAGHGGKLILYHGWADQHITPQSTLQYYTEMQNLLGADTVARFAKLYLFPGMAHCGGGLGPNTFDTLTPVMAWVETGTTPGAVIASLPDQSGKVTRTRPVYPYPQVARWTGSGSTDSAANFVPFTPSAEPNVSYAWVGSPLYSVGYESQCRAQGAKLSCTGGKPYPWERSQNGPDWALSQP